MPRPIKYANADDLLDNCTVKDDCYLWPESSTPMPMLSPNSPLTHKFGTTSVARILFTICRFVPAGPRLVHRCNNRFCVNPFHFAESRAIRAKRMELPNPNGLLPDQEDRRHLIAPPDEELTALRPKNPTHIKMLLDAAVLAGYDAQGMPDSRSYKVPPKVQPHFADPDVPVLVMQPRPAKPAPVEPEEDLWETTRAADLRDPEYLADASPLDTAGAEDDPGDDDIFALIRRGRHAMEHKR